MRIRFIFFILTAQLLSAQERASQVGIISDNDLYTSSVYDKYYTNGFELFFRYQSKNRNPAINKKITEFRIGQYIYNPQTRNADDIYRNDRPFAGYLFAEAGINRFYESESVLKTAFQFGFVGPNSFARESQRAFHYVFGYKRVYGWQHQIRHAVAAQTNLFYAKKISGMASHTADFYIQADLNAGTILNGATLSLMARFGIKPLLPMFDSSMHGAGLNKDSNFYKNRSELFFYVAPAINYQLYDATIQGSVFNNDSPVTFDLIPFRLQGEAGIKYRKNKWDLSYCFLYRGKEADNNVIKSYFYGSIVAGYMLN